MSIESWYWVLPSLMFHRDMHPVLSAEDVGQNVDMGDQLITHTH